MISSIIIAAILIFTGSILVWLLSSRLRDVSIVDIFWGLAFVLAAFTYRLGGPELSWVHLLSLVLVSAWGVRLSSHIALRSSGQGEDRRYAAMRRRHGARFWWVSLFTVFLFQAALVVMLSAPLLVVQLENGPAPNPLLLTLAVLLWVMGFAFETLADWQLFRFSRNPENKGRVLRTGIWSWSRHPNYFGETLIWWGYGLLAASVGGWWALYSPIVVTILLLRVSGVTLMEKDIAEHRPAYRDYVLSTPAFLPRPPRPRKERR